MHGVLQKLLNPLYELFYTRELESFFSWLERVEGVKAEAILINLPRQKYVCNKARRIIHEPPTACDFIICEKGQFDTLKNNSSVQTDSCWLPIFRSPHLEIWHRDSYGPDSRPLCLRLDEAEKKLLLTRARNVLSACVHKKKIEEIQSETLPQRFSYLADVDVVLWVNGALRGSMVVRNLPLLTAVERAAELSARDPRFKPVQSEELEDTTIEITIISTLRIPLRRIEFIQNEIYSEKSYFAAVGERSGWFVPAVFNCQSFKNLDHLLQTLFEQKLRLPTRSHTPRISIAEVDDFIELKSDPVSVANLSGPLVVKADTEGENTETLLATLTERGCEFLVRRQEVDGNISPVLDPLSGQSEQIDWIRLAHACWALAAYGERNPRPEILHAADKASQFLFNNLYERTTLSPYTQTLARIYHQRAIRSLKASSQASDVEVIIAGMPTLLYEPILFSQIALLILDESEHDEHVEIADRLLKQVKADFENKLKSNEAIDLASYADLVTLYQKFGEQRGESTLLDEAAALAHFYVTRQLASGAFPLHTKAGYGTTRGSGKIFEVLANRPEFSLDQRQRLLLWLSVMQYTDKNSYCIPKERQLQVWGGLRLETTQPNLWIDSVGHLLLVVTKSDSNSHKVGS